MNLTGKCCLITGGTSGIGAAAAVELARQGADIAINGRDAERGRRVCEAIEAVGRRGWFVAGDIARPEACARVVEQAAEAAGRLDVLIHSAGGPVPGSLVDVAPEAWYAAFDVHVHAIFHLARAAVPWMKKQGGGAVVLIGSGAGLRGCLGAIAYGVVKGALPHFARAMARELADDNIRVNSVSPGVIRTPFQDFLTPEQAANNIRNRIPLHREGTPEDVAAAIALLVENEFITGEDLVIDDGQTMRMV